MALRFDNVMLGSIELLCLTAEHEGFTAAANAAGLTPAAVSRSIARLEARLGVQLFSRTTRQVRLTDAGRDYVAQCRQALAQLSEAERELAGQQRVPAGTVRISLPTSYGHCRVLPLLPAFRALYPEVSLDIQLSNRNVDFAAGGFDLAVRGRTPPDSGLVARRLEDAALVVVAAPSYLASRPAPRALADLAAHECIQFTLPSTGQPVPWLLHGEGGVFEHATQGGIRYSEDILGGVTLARAGAGLLQTYRFIVEEDLARGALVELLPDFAGASRPFSLIHPAHRHMPRRVRVFIDFLLERLSSPPGPRARY
ncbi:LysR family transcriptional regulator [Variovorax paradoxus]|jgi:DNA-binding transcriptional LysR family regulator|uniref:LysR family transcriptional regulator n=1 Tax=Variovorax paradoxus TaxID=34073 RepID=UPI0006E57541|nr:LysR family transcriptional regulator [Variovorax paradoxus]KPV01811.1 LysR family transcriptional regulator [Variovorax paradoxus]KPV02543.1 LysR family transcriptional regulator [Variovorax paradoxus]KPV17990.1 LysR family transcriptional regulator [Variovorax paradoxus]KPV28831.1 LysR family transcriptional regulator [Variovorax paradoxus]